MGDCSKNGHVGCGIVKAEPSQEEMRRRGRKEEVYYTHRSESGAAARHEGPQGGAPVKSQEVDSNNKRKARAFTGASSGKASRARKTI